MTEAPSADSMTLLASLESAERGDRERGPVRILCDEIGFPFDERLERPEIIVAFAAELLAVVAHQDELSGIIKARFGGDHPADNAAAIEAARVMLAVENKRAAASHVHALCDQMNPEDVYPTNHTIDMVSSIASAVRFGLESPCRSRHAAAAADHVWKHTYGVSLFDRMTPAWEKDWARQKLQSAIISLLPDRATQSRSTPEDGKGG